MARFLILYYVVPKTPVNVGAGLFMYSFICCSIVLVSVDAVVYYTRVYACHHLLML